MKFKRSVPGTILFTLLALIHIPAFWQVVRIFSNISNIDYLELAAEIFQIVTFLIYLVMLFVPIGNRISRFVIAFIFLISLGLNAGTFIILYSDLTLVDLLSLTIVVVDILAITALCLKPTNKINVLTPFYAEESPME